MKKFLQALKWFAMAAATVFVLFMGYFYYSLSTAEARVRPLCAQIKAGTTLTDLRAFGAENGLQMPRVASDAKVTYMVERRSYGRNGCRIVMDGTAVISAEYSHQD